METTALPTSYTAAEALEDQLIYAPSGRPLRRRFEVRCIEPMTDEDRAPAGGGFCLWHEQVANSGGADCIMRGLIMRRHSITGEERVLGVVGYSNAGALPTCWHSDGWWGPFGG
jgi:hypothetical protein